MICDLRQASGDQDTGWAGFPPGKMPQALHMLGLIKFETTSGRESKLEVQIFMLTLPT